MDATSAATQPLQRQVERGVLFTHSALGEGFARIADVQALLHGLTDLPLAKGLVGEGELQEAIAPVRRELHSRGEVNGPGLLVRAESNAPATEAAVDCDARPPVCHAVCCRFDFALSVPELETGQVR